MSINQPPTIKCRFAPSPTGNLHLGGARTALFNYLFAKHSSGQYVLRIEDTDRERSTEEALTSILESLQWLGLTSDEEIIFQSKRLKLYQEYALKLLASGNAYRCYATPDELNEMRAEARKQKKKRVYDERYRPADKILAPAVLPSVTDEKPFVIRLRVPRPGMANFSDLIVGSVSTSHEEIDDFVIVRSDGSPTYNFSVVIDDHEMGISHVIRGMDHISNTPKQLLVYQAFDWAPPEFAHVPMILGNDKKKLSKRHGATSVVDYRQEGYLAEAFLNYLARLGWSHGDQEIFTLKELIEFFSLDHVNKSDAVFDFEKCTWVNSEHLKKLSNAEVFELAIPYIIAQGHTPDLSKRDKLLELVEHLKQRSKTLSELAEQMHWFFHSSDTLPYDNKAVSKHLKSSIVDAFTDLIAKIEKLDCFTETDLEAIFKQIVEDRQIKLGKLAQPVRVALTGTAVSPPIYSVLEILGQEESIARLKHALRLFS